MILCPGWDPIIDAKILGKNHENLFNYKLSQS